MDSAPGIYVASETRPVYIRVVGRGAFQNSQPLRRFAEEMITKGQREFVIDLAQCAGMDSTFLGVMTGIALRLRQNGNRGSVCIVNASARHRELLQTMGLDRVFEAVSATAEPLDGAMPAATEFEALPETDDHAGGRKLNQGEMAQVMLDAHEDLIRADERNREKFAGVTNVLREQMGRKHAEEKSNE